MVGPKALEPRPEKERIRVWVMSDKDIRPQMVGSERPEAVRVAGRRHQSCRKQEAPTLAEK